MVSMRSYASIALCLIFVLHVLRNSSVHADQGKGTKGNGLTATSEEIGASLRKEVVGGRKIVVDKVMKKEEGQNGEMSKKSGATHIATTTCYENDQGKKGLNVKCVVISDKSRISKKFGIDGFVAFGADYHVPKHHPPKNN